MAALALAVLCAHWLGLQALPLAGAQAASHETAGGALQVRVLAAPQQPVPAAAKAAPTVERNPIATPAPSAAPRPVPAAEPAEAGVPPAPAPGEGVAAWTVAAAAAANGASEEAGKNREPPAPSAARVPPPLRLHYALTGQVRGFALAGKAQIDWRHDGHRYDLNLEFGGFPFPTRYQRSTGRITPQGLAPERFSDKLRSEEAAHFDTASGHIRFSGNQADAPLMPGAQDRLSVLFQVGAMIAGKPQAWTPGRQITVQTATARDAEVWHFNVEGEEELRLPGGTQRCIRLVRQPRKEFDQKVELWLAPGLDYVPVRVRLTQPGGDWLDQQWSGTDKG